MTSIEPATPLPLDDIRDLRDPSARSAEAGRFIAYAEARAKAGRAIRDNAIREMRQLGLTVPAIATAAGVSTATVKQVIR